MTSKRLWLVVADGSRARILERPSAYAPLDEIEQLDHAAAREHGHELVSDQQGRTFDSGGQGRHAMAAPTDPKEHEKTEFLDNLAGRLNAAVAKNTIDELVLFAPATALGRLREKLSKQAMQCLAGDLNKDLATHTVPELEARLKEMVGPWDG